MDDALVVALGGAHGRMIFPGADTETDTDPEQQYWLRVWAARGLLWAWGDEALPAIVEALADEHWRVREMAAKVVARHGLGDAFEDVASLTEDPVPRVAAAATRAVRILVTSSA